MIIKKSYYGTIDTWILRIEEGFKEGGFKYIAIKPMFDTASAVHEALGSIKITVFREGTVTVRLNYDIENAEVIGAFEACLDTNPDFGPVQIQPDSLPLNQELPHVDTQPIIEENPNGNDQTISGEILSGNSQPPVEEVTDGNTQSQGEQAMKKSFEELKNIPLGSPHVPRQEEFPNIPTPQSSPPPSQPRPQTVYNEPFYKKNWFVILMMLFVAPAGIALLWINGQFTRMTRIVLTVLLSLYMIFAMGWFLTPYKEVDNNLPLALWLNGNKTETVEKADPNKIYSVGEAVTLKNGATIMVNNAVRSSGDGEVFNTPKDGKEFIIVELTIVNSGNDEISYNQTFDFECKNSQGQLQLPTSFMNLEDNGYRSLGSGALAQGGTVSGAMAFDMPAGDPNLSLIYENMFSGNDPIEIKLF